MDDGIANMQAASTGLVKRDITLNPNGISIWLPTHVRPTYTLLTIAYSVMHGLAPEYLAELLDRHHSRRVLRSASEELFSVPFSQTVRHGDRRFSVAVATLWNQLPNSVRMIETLPLSRTHLKKHLFRGAFS